MIALLEHDAEADVIDAYRRARVNLWLTSFFGGFDYDSPPLSRPVREAVPVRIGSAAAMQPLSEAG